MITIPTTGDPDRAPNGGARPSDSLLLMAAAEMHRQGRLIQPETDARESDFTAVREIGDIAKGGFPTEGRRKSENVEDYRQVGESGLGLGDEGSGATIDKALGEMSAPSFAKASEGRFNWLDTYGKQEDLSKTKLSESLGTVKQMRDVLKAHIDQLDRETLLSFARRQQVPLPRPRPRR